MKIAVEGCAHGELEKIYECIETLQTREGIKIDLLICCGDFQSVRNHEDLCAMAVQEKYQNMCSFYKYYSGEKKAPILTIFIGGNHEASNYLQELPYGGWVAPNIYYLGRAGVVKYGNLRIGGMSGIYKGQDFLQGHWECLPYSGKSLRTVYHIRCLEVFRLSQIKEKLDIMLSHDWPRGITDYGNTENLLRRKSFLREDIESNQLGSVPAMKLLLTLKPDYWFAAHLHCQYAALVKHDTDTGTETKFLALDKCLPKRRHLQILDVPSEYDGELCLRHDVEWLAILKNTNHLLCVKNVNCFMPGPGGHVRHDFTPTQEEKENVIKLLGSLLIKQDSFVRTAPVYNPQTPKTIPLVPIMNPQTVHLCEKLGIDDPVEVVMAQSGQTMKQPYVNTSPPNEDLKPDSPIEIVSSSISESPVMQSTITQSMVNQTPVKTSKLPLLLPAPVTPRENEKSPPVSSPDSSAVENSFDSLIYECKTPTSAGPKKTFKRRNMSIYNTPDADGSADSTSLLDPDSPQSSKYTCRENLSHD